MTSENRRSIWVTNKCNIATALSRGEAGGSYSEAAILVCAALSALSADVWPGRGLDRKRFIEMLVRFASSSNLYTMVSVPLLLQDLVLQQANKNQPNPDIAALRNAFMPFGSARVITGSEIDKTEDEVLSLCASLSRTSIRKFSYATLLYEEVRSSYAHEYRPSEKADSWPMTMLKDQSVSYVNRFIDSTSAIERRIHFHVEWLTKTTIGLARQIDLIQTNLPLDEPSVWWADGAP